MKRLVFLVMGWFGLVLGVGPAVAAEQISALSYAAIPVQSPGNTLLISVSRAGDRLVAVGGHGVIVYSDDNGKTWVQAAVPVSVSITCVAFFDARNGWAAGAQGVILRTTDGGASWKTQIEGAQILPLMLANARAVAAANPADDTAQRALRRATIFTGAGPDKPFLTILPLSAQSAIVFGAYRMAVITTDGGKTWSDWSLNVGDPVSHNLYAVTRAGSAIFLAGELGTVLRSDDQGQHFTLVTSPDTSTMLGILGTHDGAILTFGVAGEVFKSTDQGQSWTQLNISTGSDLTSGTVLKSGEVLLVTADGRVFGNTDHGDRFHDLGLNEGMALFDVAQAANGDVVFVGSGGARVVASSAFN